MKKTVAFLSALYKENNKVWFDRHNEQYKEALKEFNAFTEKLIEGIAAFDPSVAGLAVKDCTYRIYRDVRFSHNKTPYKTHMGAYICRGGKKSGFAGYYFHVEPVGENLLGGNLLASGLHMPEPKVLKSVREEISFNGEQLVKNIKKSKGFELDQSLALSRVPQGFAKDNPYAEYLKLKDVILLKSLTNEEILDEKLLEQVLALFKNTRDFNEQLNRAVEFAYEDS